MFIKNLKELEEKRKFFLDKILKICQDKNINLFFLEGDLGFGKTTFVKNISKELKIEEEIISPTFIILKKYKIKNKNFPWKNLIHIDAYRLSKKDDIKNIGLDKYLKDKKNLILIEWAENISEFLKEYNSEKIIFKYISENEREIKI